MYPLDFLLGSEYYMIEYYMIDLNLMSYRQDRKQVILVNYN